MTPAEVAAKLRAFNEWRRGDEDIPQPDPRVIGEAIDAAVEMIDRLEAAEKERGSATRLADSLALALNTSNHERDNLRAKIEGRATGAQSAPSVPMDVIADYLVSISAHLARRDDAKAQAEIGELLKMIASAPKPGASVPEDLMRDAERYRYLRARDDETAGVGCWIEADGMVCDRGWLYGVQLDSAIDSFIEVLAAAPKPEAKP